MSLLLTLLVIGFVLWILQKAPIDGTIKQIIWGVAILIAIVITLQYFGVIGELEFARIK